ncbi:isoprenoid synthase domain-containing protein [Leucosporidium creatinivorum]|uniref:(2E,6E)-farnesyl diphosphate synthase n=1 Tax=Leucosporidium creatinivorum TaxID=106004 RepID=A0A1Y2F5W6_9BASI|nr:isoprenoid synthase domain-containing protein [Leucosporidium creatinivorum]
MSRTLPISRLRGRARPSSSLLQLPTELQKLSSSPTSSLRHASPSRSAWTSAIPGLSSATPFASTSTSSSLLAGSSKVALQDPLKLLGAEMGLLRSNVQHLLGSGHPALDTIAKYYFQAEGKHVRPMLILLMSQATNGLAPGWEQRRDQAAAAELKREQGDEGLGGDDIDEPLSPPSVLNDQNPSMLASAKSFFSDPLASLRPAPTPTSIAQSIHQTHLLPSQRRLAEITEMIHVASLLHDDVIDLAETRRSAPSAPSLFGNKLSILAGDFLLARASLALSRLGSNEVVELVASVLANLVEGEVMQMKGNVPGKEGLLAGAGGGSTAKGPTPEIFDHYMKKTYLKTASLIAKSTRATTILGGCGVKQGWAEGEKVKDIAYSYGRNLGIAFQLVDDMLDFTASAAQLGKPGGGADLKLGLATAPALYAWEEFPELGAMIERKFAGEDDVEQARHLISRSSGAERTAALAAEHSKLARQALEGLPDSEARTALDNMARDTLSRKK